MPKLSKPASSKQTLYTYRQVIDLVIKEVAYVREELELKHKQEIELWQSLRNMWKRLYEATLPKKRGRPKKKYVPVDGPLASLFGDALLTTKASKKNGRPKKYQNPKKSLEEWESWKKLSAEKLGKKWAGDKDAINYMVDNSDHTLCKSLVGRTAYKKRLSSAIKQWRDSTGSRIHKRTKAENPQK